MTTNQTNHSNHSNHSNQSKEDDIGPQIGEENHCEESSQDNSNENQECQDNVIHGKESQESQHNEIHRKESQESEDSQDSQDRQDGQDTCHVLQYQNIDEWCRAQVETLKEFRNSFDKLVRNEVPKIQKIQTQLARLEIKEIETSAYLDQIEYIIAKIGLENVNKKLLERLNEINCHAHTHAHDLLSLRAHESNRKRRNEKHRMQRKKCDNETHEIMHHKRIDIIEAREIDEIRGFINAILDIKDILQTNS